MGAEHISFTLQATRIQLKSLFRKKDDVEAILRHVGYPSEGCHSMTIYDALRFYACSTMKKTTNKYPVAFDNLDLPVVKLHLSLTPGQWNELKEFLSKIRGQLNQDGDDLFRIFSNAFDHVLAQKSKFQQFIKPGFVNSRVSKECSTTFWL